MLHMFATLATLVLFSGVVALIAAMIDEHRDAIGNALGVTPIRFADVAPARHARVKWRPVASPVVARGLARRAA